MLNILQDHYPERLGKAFIINVPYFVQLFLKLIMPFVDPKTKEKIRLNPSVVDEKFYLSTEITTKWGGDINFVYEHGKYWPALLSLCQKRQAAEAVRWQELGGLVGISEWDIKSTLKAVET